MLPEDIVIEILCHSLDLGGGVFPDSWLHVISLHSKI